MLSSIFDSIIVSSGLAIGSFMACLGSALVLGAALAWAYSFRSEHTKSFVLTMGILPAVVSIVIMMVSGSLGAGIAVAGTFSLVRFRSVPGTAREITSIFLAMAVGLACGMGYIAFAAIFTLIMGTILVVYTSMKFGEPSDLERTLIITVPEDLEYGSSFDDLFKNYTTSCKMVRVKTTNLGSLNRLTYNIKLKDAASEKALIDELRVRNGNLEISSSLQSLTEGVTL